MQRILLPHDGSDCANRALDYLISCAADLESVEVHVVNVQPLADEWIVHRLLSESELAKMAEEYGADTLEPVTTKLQTAGLKTVAYVKRGDIGKHIVDLANQVHANMIVMGTHGLSALSGLLLGSVATQVLHLATCPVTLVK